MLEKALPELTKGMPPQEAQRVKDTYRDMFAAKRRRDRGKLLD
jgi:hypothetical protein